VGDRGGGAAGVVWRGYSRDRAVDGADVETSVAGEGVDRGVSGFESRAIPDVGVGKPNCCAKAVCRCKWSGKICNVRVVAVGLQTLRWWYRTVLFKFEPESLKV